MTTIADLATRALELAAERNRAIVDARRPDPDLTTEANTERACEQVRVVTAKYAEAFADLRATAAELVAEARAAADRLHTLNRDDVAALVRSEQAWTHVVKPALDRGETLGQALAAADNDAVAGAQRFAAAWLTGRYGTEADTSSVAKATAARLAELDPANAETILTGASADDHLVAFDAVLNAAERGDQMGAAITAKSAFETTASTSTAEDGPSTGRGLAASIGARYTAV